MLFYMTVPGLEQAISQYWGYTTFRPLQKEAMDAVLVLDDRLVTKRYGRYMRESLPDAPLVKGPWEQIRSRLRRFYGAAPDTLGGAPAAP